MSSAEPPVSSLELHFHRVLVAIDGSANAEMALAAGVAVAQRDHASLTLLVVVPDVRAEATRWVAGAPDPAQIQDEADAAAQRTLTEAVARIPEDIPVTTVIRRGKAGPEIVAQSRDRDYDVILVGARGLGRVGALFGSVSSYVLHHADTAVFVAHAPRG